MFWFIKRLPEMRQLLKRWSAVISALFFFSELETINEEDEAEYLDTPDTGLMPEEVVEHRDLQLEIQHAIHSLPCIHRIVVFLYYREHMNFADIGQVLTLPVSTVKARWKRAKPILRATLTAL